jgi:hypothetical protein
LIIGKAAAKIVPLMLETAQELHLKGFGTPLDAYV